ncbi:cobalamin-independent methionine synthase II family protein [Chloroflexi bacterium TSY]|nr:cobalamin-independent methionine synthase II family protein [Chloroflexi bacterium TSY]
MNQLPLFPASVVGSIPRPLWVQALFAPHAVHEFGQDNWLFKLDTAVAFVIAFQETAGLDIITDGEWRRTSYLGIIADLLNGFEQGLKVAPYWLTVTRKLRRKKESVVAQEVQFLKAHTDRLTKVCLPAPYLLGRRMWDAELSREAYRTREEFMEALVPYLRDELLAARDAGVDIVQFDDTHLCQFVDAKKRAKFADPEQEMQLCVDLLNAVIEGIDGVTIAIHLCRGNSNRRWGAEGGYGPILPALKLLNVNQYVMEFSMPAAGEMDVLSSFSDDDFVGVGCVDCRSEQIDTPEEIVARVRQALKYLKPEQISLNPDCGFAPGISFDISLDEVYLKLQNEVEAARILREEWQSK